MDAVTRALQEASRVIVIQLMATAIDNVEVPPKRILDAVGNI